MSSIASSGGTIPGAVRRVAATVRRRFSPALLGVLSLLTGLAEGCGWSPEGGHGVTARTRALQGGASLDARALVIAANPDSDAAQAIRAALDRLGTPFTVLNAATTPLTAGLLASGDHGFYQAVFLDDGLLGGAFSAAAWQILSDYEASFGVRRVSLVTQPDAGYGYAGFVALSTTSSPLQASCTSAGAQLFAHVNCQRGVVLAGPRAFAGHGAAAGTVPLLVATGDQILAATHAYPDGREVLTLNFEQVDDAWPTMQVIYDAISWAARGLFLGARHGYIGVQIDDLFLASVIYPQTGDTYRIDANDLQAFFDWQQRWRQQPNQADFRADFAVNTAGASAGDGLTMRAQQINQGFKWISHTFDHAELTNLTYAETRRELDLNNTNVVSLGLTPYSVQNLVTPGITGLANVEAMRAAYDAGVRFMVSDSSLLGSDNPAFNEGLPEFVDSRLFLIPRRATDLDFDVSTPAEWLLEFNDLEGTTFDYETLLDYESNILLGYLLRGENDPWMFHQANCRAFSGTSSLLSDLLDRTFTKYNALVSFPLLSPTMDGLAAAVLERTSTNHAQVSAVIEPGVAITVTAQQATTVPITGACGSGAEHYAGQSVAHVAVGAGATVRIDLRACGGDDADGGAGADGGVGRGGAAADGGEAGQTGSGGTTGTGGAIPGTGGVTGTGGAGTGGAGVGGAGTGGVGIGGAGIGGSGTGGAGTGGAGIGGSGVGGAGTGGAGTGGAGTGGTIGTAGTGTGGSGAGGSGAGGTITADGGAAGRPATDGGGGHADATHADGGGSPPVHVDRGGGCSCASAGANAPASSGGALALFTVAVAWMRARRRRASDRRLG